ncbi:MAG: heavy metal translocating P-type ATPase [Haloferacaceae archaeon]
MTASTDDGAEAACELCGLPLADDGVTNDRGEAFCCPGCRDVHDALGDVAGVDEADVRAGTDAGDDRERDDGPPDGCERTFLRMGGMHCTTCETFVEAVATDVSGVDAAAASYVTEMVRVDHDPDRVTAADLAERLSVAGYTASRTDEGTRTGTADGEDDLVFWRLAVGVLLAMWVMLPYLILIYPVHFALVYPTWMLETFRGMLTSTSAQYFFLVEMVFTGLVLLVTGGPILKGAYVSLRARSPNMDLLVALAAVSAFLYSTVAAMLGRLDVYYDVTVSIVVVVTAGTYYESAIKHRATEKLSELTTAQVDEARRYDPDGSTTAVDVDDLDPGDRVLVRTGERIPVDGVVCESECTVNEAVVTGESLPVEKADGDEIVGGSVLTDGAAVVEVGADASSSIDRITDLVWNLQSANRGVQKLANRLAVVFVPGVVTLAVLAGAAYLVLGAGVTAAVLVSLTVLLVSCPCALGLATPLALASGIREALERGIVVFDQTVFERLRSVDVVAFDKTGTLTTGELTVVDADAPPDLLGAVAALERRSSHPVADAIVGAFGGAAGARADGGTPVEARESAAGERANRAVDGFRSHASGVGGTVDGVDVLAGHPDLFAARGWSVPDAIGDRVAEAREAGRLPVVVGRDGAAEGVVVAGDDPRADWEAVVSGLDERGVEVVVLTGDEATAAERFRRHPGVDRVFAGVPPEAKAETVRRLGDSRRVAMVGDGTNDAPALASADLGIALGSGTALAVDAADVAIVDDDLRSIETVFDLSTAAGRRVKENIGWAFLYNAIAIPLALLGYLNPLFATVAMATSSLLVVTNSSRTLVDDDE